MRYFSTLFWATVGIVVVNIAMLFIFLLALVGASRAANRITLDILQSVNRQVEKTLKGGNP
jgi:hypothetical protein